MVRACSCCLGHYVQSLATLILTLLLRRSTASENMGNLVDPCYFPTPQYINFAGLCQHYYHRVKFVCDPLALLSRTEAEILNKRFENYSLSGCVDCETTIGKGCVPKDVSNSARISLLIVPYTNTQRIELCVAGRFRNSRLTASEAARAYAELVMRNWGESGCAPDLTILYVGTLHNPMTNVRQPRPLVVRLFTNNLVHLSHLSSVKIVTDGKNLVDALQSELNQSLSMAHFDSRLTGSAKLNHKPNHFGGVPLWAFEICGVLLLLVVVTVYLGNCLTKRFDTRAQQKKFNNRVNGLLNANGNGANGSNDRWRAGFGGGLISNAGGGNGAMTQNTSLMGNLAVQNTKSSMMFRQFGAHNAKKQQDRAKSNVQKI